MLEGPGQTHWQAWAWVGDRLCGARRQRLGESRRRGSSARSQRGSGGARVLYARMAVVLMRQVVVAAWQTVPSAAPSLLCLAQLQPGRPPQHHRARRRPSSYRTLCYSCHARPRSRPASPHPPTAAPSPAILNGRAPRLSRSPPAVPYCRSSHFAPRASHLAPRTAPTQHLSLPARPPTARLPSVAPVPRAASRPGDSVCPTRRLSRPLLRRRSTHARPRDSLPTACTHCLHPLPRPSARCNCTH